MKKAIYISILVILISCKNEKNKPNPLVIEYQEKGIEFQMQNKTDSAIVYFKKALEIDPTDIPTYESLVKTYWWNKQPELALGILESVPTEMQKTNSILTLKGMTLEKMDKLNHAMDLYKTAFEQSPKIRYENEKNLMEYIGYLTLQTIIGEKQKAIAELDRLKSKKLTESEKQYVNSIEPYIRNYKGGGYNAIFVNE
ncbi:tetratricopeptide repeat protein [Winogradskyella sp. J14-2]|uniref:tetratricopeptide repeat protein n=1 Tax=Winogradskyella sp. J14-2 TaxID=1936080 RepID=UPI0012F78197|nr:tetratricopeptide repeat protein [Winogradskyella sp. J14-2]